MSFLPSPDYTLLYFLDSQFWIGEVLMLFVSAEHDTKVLCPRLQYCRDSLIAAYSNSTADWWKYDVFHDDKYIFFAWRFYKKSWHQPATLDNSKCPLLTHFYEPEKGINKSVLALHVLNYDWPRRYHYLSQNSSTWQLKLFKLWVLKQLFEPVSERLRHASKTIGKLWRKCTMTFRLGDKN